MKFKYTHHYTWIKGVVMSSNVIMNHYNLY